MLKFKYLNVLFLIIIFLSCNEKKAVAALEKETMNLHDEAMKAMGPMNTIGRDLRKQMATLDSLSPKYTTLRAAAASIERAESDMMDWMQNYNPPADDMPETDALKYLKEQKSMMQKNVADIKAAAETGKKALGQ